MIVRSIGFELEKIGFDESVCKTAVVDNLKLRQEWIYEQKRKWLET